MACLAPEFKFDVFVSYSHGDVDRNGNSLLKTWSQAFARELEREIRGLPGFQDCLVFLDESKRPEQGLASTDPLTQQLRDAATGSAFLLLIMSPHYLASDWCKDERDWWLQQSAANTFPELGSRIFIARIWPTGKRTWPRELCDERGNQNLGVWFHERPGNELISRPFGWVDQTSNSEFRRALVDLSGQIGIRVSKLGEALVRKREMEANLAKLGNDSGQLIYVHARARNKKNWEKAFNDLAEAGYGVVPVAPEPEYQDEQQANVATKEIVRTLSACDGLLMVPDSDPYALVADLTVVGRQWRNSARSIARKPLPCAVVDGGQVVEAKERVQLSAKTLRIDWIDGALANWTGQMKHWLATAASVQTMASK
jgi:hypothetical protein